MSQQMIGLINSAFWQTLDMVVISTLIAVVGGLPLGVFLFVTQFSDLVLYSLSLPLSPLPYARMRAIARYTWRWQNASMLVHEPAQEMLVSCLYARPLGCLGDVQPVIITVITLQRVKP